MKIKGRHILAVASFALSLFIGSNAQAQNVSQGLNATQNKTFNANTVVHGQRYGQNINNQNINANEGYGNKNINLAYRKCRWVGGFWRHGHWYPARKVCWRTRHRCKWIPGHWRHGRWIKAHRVCW